MNAPVAVRPDKATSARIGPHSVLHLVPLLDESLGTDERRRLLDLSGLPRLPPASGLMAEGPAALLHQTVRREHPGLAPLLIRRAGERTGDFIIAHRIPTAALMVLRRLPPWLAAPLLAGVIERHAWTFAGSGRFRIASRQPLAFILEDNPVVRGEHAEHPLCAWHAAVFERLFRRIVDERFGCTETHCCAMGEPACRFELRLPS